MASYLHHKQQKVQKDKKCIDIKSQLRLG